MTLPYGVISDPHYHRWGAFATTNADGLNSRLEIQLDATKEAAKAMKAAGCKHMLVAGDTFHVRGAISPSVLHFVTETYEWIIKELGLKVVMLAGNHDLETNDSVYSANAAASLRSIGVEIVCGKRPHSIKMGDVTVHLISWRNNHAELISDLKTLRSGLDGDNHDVVVHTSINKAIPTMPDVGIDAQELKDIGFRLLLSGHYHNHKEVLPGVVSIGALTHQNWGDVGSLAGFMIVKPDGSFTHHETSAPKFVNLEDDVDDDQIRGNYQFDKIVMNPPYSLGRHREHTLAALEHLKVGGRLVAVLPGDAPVLNWMSLDNYVYAKGKSFTDEFEDTGITVSVYVFKRVK